ncbi:unnamed protein product [Parajaminaea phylloscopi]
MASGPRRRRTTHHPSLPSHRIPKDESNPPSSLYLAFPRFRCAPGSLLLAFPPFRLGLASHSSRRSQTKATSTPPRATGIQISTPRSSGCLCPLEYHCQHIASSRISHV